MIKWPELMLEGDAEMRAFYESCGIGENIIVAAIEARRKTREPHPLKRKQKLAKA